MRDDLVTVVQTCALPISHLLPALPVGAGLGQGGGGGRGGLVLESRRRPVVGDGVEIGRASCRERVEISGGPGSVKEKRRDAGGGRGGARETSRCVAAETG